MNIKGTMESLNNLINRKKGSRKVRHTTFMKQQKRTLVNTLKQDKIYRQHLEHFQEEMFNSTITRNKATIEKKSKSLKVPNNKVKCDNTSSQSITNISPLLPRPLHDSKNIKIVISKIVMESSNSVDDAYDVSQDSPNVTRHSLNLNSSLMARNELHFQEILNLPRTSYMEEFMNIKAMHAETFFNLTRMSQSLFDDLVELVTSDVCLAITLIYLAEGVNFHILSEQFGITVSTVQDIILTTSKQLLDGIKHKVLSDNISCTEFHDIALQYREKCDLPNCVGSLDAHCIFSKNPLLNYGFAIDILAACSPNFQISFAEVFVQHNSLEKSKRDVLNKSKLMNELVANIPTLQLPNSNTYTQGFFIAPSSLCSNTINIIARPIRSAGVIERRFRRALNVSQMTFALINKNWKCLKSENLIVAEATTIDETCVWAMLCLHNYILKNADDWLREFYCPANYIDQFDDDGKLTKGKWRADLRSGNCIPKTPTSTLITVNRGSMVQESHKEYLDYILNEGSC